MNVEFGIQKVTVYFSSSKIAGLPCSPRIAMDLSSKVFIYKASMFFVFLDAILFHHKVSYEN